MFAVCFGFVAVCGRLLVGPDCNAGFCKVGVGAGGEAGTAANVAGIAVAAGAGVGVGAGAATTATGATAVGGGGVWSVVVVAFWVAAIADFLAAADTCA